MAGLNVKFAGLLRAIPIILALGALFSYSFMDWFGDRYFYLWGRPSTPLKLWGFSFDKLTLNSKAPSFIKAFLYSPRGGRSHQSSLQTDATVVTGDTPDSFLWQANKFFSRCFPRNKFDHGITNALSSSLTYFWYLTSEGRNVPVVSVSLEPIRDKETVWINIFNGCVTGLLRGLGFGPFYFVETVKKYVEDKCIDGNGNRLPEDNILFAYSVQLNYNPYAVHTCASYVSSGILRYLYIGALPNNLRQSRRTVSMLRGNQTRFSLTSLLEQETFDDELFQSLVIENEYDFYRDICMVGQIDVMRTAAHKYNPCTKQRAEKICRRIVNFMDRTYA